MSLEARSVLDRYPIDVRWTLNRYSIDDRNMFEDDRSNQPSAYCIPSTAKSPAAPPVQTAKQSTVSVGGRKSPRRLYIIALGGYDRCGGRGMKALDPRTHTHTHTPDIPMVSSGRQPHPRTTILASRASKG